MYQKFQLISVKKNDQQIVGSLAEKARRENKKMKHKLVYCLHFLFVIQNGPYI